MEREEALWGASNNEPSFELGSKHGCLEILDDGQEYRQIVADRIIDIEKEKTDFIDLINNKKLKREDWYGWDGNHAILTPAYVYEPKTFSRGYDSSIRVEKFDNVISYWRDQLDIKHYKCRCRKCGKIHHYNWDTIQTNPTYCYKPVYCSNRFTYSNQAINANYRKKEKYGFDESVRLVNDKNEVMPSEDYCGKWNEKREKDLRAKEEKEAAIIAALPRIYAKNYDRDFVGMIYESLEVLECTNDALEKAHYIHQHHKYYGNVFVYKEYKCRCYLCEKEHIITCDQFGIYPPTDYGVRAYNGYWSVVGCNCHEISSFQWMVNKLLVENSVSYRVEYSYPDLLGAFGQNKLRFDFAVLNNDGTVKCLIECQGKQHFEPVQEYGGEYTYKVQVENDDLKREYVKEHGIRLIEISYKKQGFRKIKKILEENGIIEKRE